MLPPASTLRHARAPIDHGGLTMADGNERTLFRRSPLREPRRPLIAIAAGAVASIGEMLIGDDHGFTSAVIAALAIDLWLVLRFCLRLSQPRTRLLFETAALKRSTLLLRATMVFVISIMFLFFSINKIPLFHGDKSFRFGVYLLGIQLCWMQLQLAFAIYYAKLYFKNNPLENSNIDNQNDDGGQQELIFPGADEPVFSDFLYVSVTIALTFATSDVSVESSQIGRAHV